RAARPSATRRPAATPRPPRRPCAAPKRPGARRKRRGNDRGPALHLPPDGHVLDLRRDLHRRPLPQLRLVVVLMAADPNDLAGATRAPRTIRSRADAIAAGRAHARARRDRPRPRPRPRPGRPPHPRADRAAGRADPPAPGRRPGRMRKAPADAAAGAGAERGPPAPPTVRERNP